MMLFDWYFIHLFSSRWRFGSNFIYISIVALYLIVSLIICGGGENFTLLNLDVR